MLILLNRTTPNYCELIVRYRRAAEAWDAGHFTAEVVPVVVKSKRGDIEVSANHSIVIRRIVFTLSHENIRAQHGPGASRRLLHPKRAPPFRRDVAGDRLAGVRSDEQIAPVALFAVFGRRLIFYRALRHFRFRAAAHQRQERRGPRGANKNRAAADARWLASIAHLGLPSNFASEMPRASRPRRGLSEPIHLRKVRLSTLLYFDLGQEIRPRPTHVHRSQDRTRAI